MKTKIKDIKIRMDLYPRFEVDNRKVQEYSENVDLLPPILINQDNILIDGLHRLKAHKQAELKEIECEVEKTTSDNEIYLRAIETNAKHGLQLSMKDKQSLAVRLYDLKNRERLIKSLSIAERTFDNWVSKKSKQLKEEKEEKAILTYLHAELTQKEVAERIGVSEGEMSKILTNCKFAEWKDFIPFLYNIWRINTITNDTLHFGQIPHEFIENLLYYYTEPFDIIYDPFAGGGVTIDVCKKWFRRYYVSDRKPIPAREEEIKQWDIKNGLPDALPSPQLVFLDPPYWKQAENKYSKDKEDLANMDLDKFYSSMENLFKNLKKKMKSGSYIALIIRSSKWKTTNWETEDHTFVLMKQLEKLGFKEVDRISCPYSTEQFNAQQVNIAKEKKILLNLDRDLVVFKLK